MFFDNRIVKDNEVKAVVELIADRLRRMREAKGWSQEAVAQTAEIPVSHYGAVERAERNFQINTFIKVLKAFDVDILDLFDIHSKRRSATASVRLRDPVRAQALEQVTEFLQSAPDDEVKNAAWNIRRWYDGLPR